MDNPPSPDQSTVSELEAGVIDLFVNGVRILGLPKSIGEIYGLLYISEDPMSLDEIIGKLAISKGSVSQGLRFLRNLGAVKVVYQAGQRKDFYRAETQLKPLVSGFLREEVEPHLESGVERLEVLEKLAGETGDEFSVERVERLRNWRDRAARLMPLVSVFLGKNHKKHD